MDKDELMSVSIQKFKGKKEALIDILDDLKNLLDKTPDETLFVFKCECKEIMKRESEK